MAVTYQVVSSSQAGTASVNVSWPSHVTNDIGILVLESNSAIWTAPSGWTLVDTSDAVTTELNIYWKRAASSAEAAVATGFPTGADHVIARIYTFRGCVTTGSPILITATSTKLVASTSYSAPSITTTTANEFVVYGVSRDNDSSSTIAFANPTNSNLVSPTEIIESGTILGDGGGFVLGYGVKTTAGATGTTTGTVTSSVNASITFSLREPIELNVTVGTFARAGITTGLLKTSVIYGTTSTFDLVGNNSLFQRIIRVDATTQTYDVAGTTTGLLLNRQLVSQTGTFSIAGVDVILQYNSSGVAFTLDTVVGAYSLTGTTLTLSQQVSLDLQAGTYSLFGNTLGFIRSLALHSVPGSFSVSGKDAVFSLTKRFSLTTGTYTVSGNNAEVNRFYQLNNQPGTYQVVGSGLDYFSSRNLVTLPLDIVADFRSVGNFFWYQTTQTIQPVKYKITKRNEFILGRQTHMGRRGL